MRMLGFVSQKPLLLSRSVIANLDYVLALSGHSKAVRPAMAEAALERAGLRHLAHQDARSLSAGEQQRLALARAIVAVPRVLILDEPTANLDPASAAAIEQRLLELRDGGTPVLFITHDLAQARRIAGNVVFMHAGKILEQRPAAEFFGAARSEEAQRFIRGELLASRAVSFLRFFTAATFSSCSRFAGGASLLSTASMNSRCGCAVFLALPIRALQ